MDVQYIVTWVEDRSVHGADALSFIPGTTGTCSQTHFRVRKPVDVVLSTKTSTQREAGSRRREAYQFWFDIASGRTAIYRWHVIVLYILRGLIVNRT